MARAASGRTARKATDGRRLRRHPDIAFRVIDGQAVIVVPATQSMHTLNEVGTFIWQQCDGKSVDEIVRLVVAEFDVKPSAARKDLDSFIRDLVDKRVLVVE